MRRGAKGVDGAMSPHKLIEVAAFEPETIALLIQAYEAAVMIVGRDQPLLVLETIAKRILEIAGRGERDPKKMVEYAMRGLEGFQPGTP
jgi:hypothetical protein